ncbi:hypothetical protein GVO57_10465 [Sphingomonas changnyeongensis]|uniref:Uncharacterized protein n=1 Tax=Sphingomonas changnyeongensis TaxID=2698679 RepID=A0A7Z2NWQ9_9SPHN|nr:hypothetical protein [Sphingomonas changnyeongensis]QHL91162.1 hypothetical protein GVO57_10465 [Sphingomonas changnyeongensis]
MLSELRAIIEVQVAKALDGDSGAAALVLARVLAAVAAGSLSADVGKLVIDGISALSEARRTEELEAVLAALEEKQR